jgi:endonuclease/exonuclease/phosphatase (EEP) superfamily protein YafD
MQLSKFIALIVMGIGLLLVVCTFISILHSTSYWFIQIFNFPRLQALLVMIISLAIYVSIQKRKSSKWAVGAIALTIIINIYYLFPYTSLAPTSVKSASAKNLENNTPFSILVANVYMKNRQADSLLSIVHRTNPTLLLTMEVNHWWVNKLHDLDNLYPYKILFPTENTYGMALYSKLPLSDIETLIFNHDSVPSFLCTVTMPNDQQARLLTIHPVAPKSSKHPDNKNDKEIGLIAAGHIISQATLPAIVAGDFNDVGWSPNVNKFEELSGLKDVRCGRGLYNTFSAHNPIMRWPLDYVYVSPHFRVVDIERLPTFGSDHFPLLTTLVLANE